MATTMTTESAESNETTTRTGTARPVTSWRRTYARRLWISDLLVLVWVVYGTQIAWFGLGAADLAIQTGRVAGEVSYWGFSGALIIVWMLALSLADTRDRSSTDSERARAVRGAKLSGNPSSTMTA